MENVLNIDEIKTLYPNEWVLVGNPIKDNNKIDVVAGIPIFHSKDKKEVCYKGRGKTKEFEKITLIFTGNLESARKMTGIFNRLK